MKTKNLILATAVLMMALGFNSCELDDEVTSPLVESTMDDDEVTTYFDDVLAETDDMTTSDSKDVSPINNAPYLSENSGSSGTRNVETSFSGDTVIKTITYTNFVNGNSQMEKVKNGQIIIKMIRNPFPGEFKRIITMNNFTINGNLIEGKKQIVRSESNQYQFNITLEGGKVTFTDGRVYTHEFIRTRTMLDGMATPAYVWDDIYAIEGAANGVNCSGQTYTHTIQNALMHKLACRWIVEGTVEIVVGDIHATFDYGDGTCDNVATVTVNGKTYEVRLRGKGNS